MTDIVDYYVSPISPWTYLGHEALVALAKQHRAPVAVKPIDLGRVFPVSGGLPLAKRAPQRQAYRLVELKRWSAHRGIALNLTPKHFPAPADPASLWIVAAAQDDQEAGLRLLGAIGRAYWADERDIGAADTLRAIAAEAGLDAGALTERAAAPDTRMHYDTLTQEAIDRGVFGVPTYVLRGEMFWGQDRLDFLGRALAQ
jgi:2-hydroxychromene-2-carboxylate isomerase